MKKLIFLLVLLQSFYSFSQQKKIALIIGNSNYADGKLKNPVNDALLMSQTFKELGFDIILDTNIDTRQDFLTTIRNYQKRRD
jgi:squalene cyclase